MVSRATKMERAVHQKGFSSRELGMRDARELSRCRGKLREHLLLAISDNSRAPHTREDKSCSNVAIMASVRKSILCFKGLLTNNNRRLAEFGGALKLLTAVTFFKVELLIGKQVKSWRDTAGVFCLSLHHHPSNTFRVYLHAIDSPK